MIKIVGLILELATGRNPKCCQILNLGLPYSGAYMHILEDANYAVTGKKAFVNVHLYSSAKVAFSAGAGSIELEQSSNWPWDDTIAFALQNPNQVPTIIRLRIPAWSNNQFILDPPLPSNPGSATIEQGYLTLSPEYVAANPKFSLKISGFEARWKEPHPYTKQNTVFLARGPVVYCAEDAHNPRETDHFRNVAIKRGSPVREDFRT
ncbi:hypothetical protein EKO04_011193 [Ascochyta lentis]|uniref:Non-reducing end beta-L-arabinofuranosidase-like GH127 middle domain-containing protein n=1 Tax=Ascochyta lentis TaxID=205686 RepID=A0A8H7MDM3_9PLEO|nr:hypothetical protein EKO04_011193 [Ascochyta lentis]